MDQLKADPVDDFRNLVVEETDQFVLEELDFDEEDMFLSATYTHIPTDFNVTVYLEYGSTDRIREVASATSSIHKITQATDRQEFFDAMDREELRAVPFDDLVDRAEIFRWQLEHSTLSEDYPFLQLLPIQSGDFELWYVNDNNPKALNVNYDASGAVVTPSLTIYHGASADIHHTSYACNISEQNEIEVNGVTFYTEHREIRGDQQVDARGYFDNVLLEFTYRYGDAYGTDPDESEVDAVIEEFLDGFEFDPYRTYEFPKIERPTPGIEPFVLDADEFSRMFPEPDAPLVVEDIESYEDAMHIRVDYYHEPDDFRFSTHIAYRGYSQRIQTPLSTGVGGNFRGGFEFCLQQDVNHMDYVQMAVMPDGPEMVRWEMENVDLSGMNPLAEFFEPQFGDYSITSYSSDEEDLRFTAEYEHNETGDVVAISARYGDSAAEQYNRYHLFGFEEEHYPFEAGGLSFSGIVLRDNFVAYSYDDHLMVEAGLQNVSDPENVESLTSQVSSLLTDFDVQRITDWQAPDDIEMVFDGTTDDGTPICLDPYCMDEKLAQCEPAVFGGQVQWNLGVLYRIEEADGSQCRLSMTYTRNPNDEVEGKPLYFYIDQDENFSDVARQRVTDCLEGETDQCYGPLLDAMQ